MYLAVYKLAMRLAPTTARLASSLSQVRDRQASQRIARRIKLVMRWLASPCGGAL